MRGLVLLLLSGLLLVGAALTGLEPARTLGAALLAMTLLGMALSAAAGVGLRLHVAAHPAVITVGESAQLRAEVSPRALVQRVPIARVQLHVAETGHPSEHHGPGGGLGAQPGGGVSVVVHPPRRGTHRLGSVQVRATDILGMGVLTRRSTNAAQVTAVPALEDAETDPSSLAGGSAHAHSGDVSPIPRPYTTHDDIRRIHWRASARGYGLMTREEEPATSRTAVVLLDTRAPAAAGRDEGAGAAAGRPGGAGGAAGRAGGAAGRAGGVAGGAEGEVAGPHNLARQQREDRAVGLAASLTALLEQHHWRVRLLDATGTTLAALGSDTAGPSTGGLDARGGAGQGARGGAGPRHDLHAMQLALADLAFTAPPGALAPSADPAEEIAATITISVGPDTPHEHGASPDESARAGAGTGAGHDAPSSHSAPSHLGAVHSPDAAQVHITVVPPADDPPGEVRARRIGRTLNLDAPVDASFEDILRAAVSATSGTMLSRSSA